MFRSRTITSAPMPAATDAAFRPALPAPSTTTRAGETPATPPMRSPRPPAGRSRWWAPAWVAMRPAISLIGASSGQCPCGQLDGLVSDCRDPAFEQALGFGGVGGEVQVREEQLAGSEHLDLVRLRLLDLYYELRSREDVLGVLDDLGADGSEVVVFDRRAGSRPCLDDDLMAAGRELAHPDRRDRDAVLLGLDLGLGLRRSPNSSDFSTALRWNSLAAHLIGEPIRHVRKNCPMRR